MDNVVVNVCDENEQNTTEKKTMTTKNKMTNDGDGWSNEQPSIVCFLVNFFS